MWGTTNLHVRNALVTLSLMMRSKKASSISASGLRATSPPVTFTRMPIESPKASRVSRTRFFTSEVLVMSQRTAIARPPAASMAAAVALPSPELLHHVNATFATHAGQCFRNGPADIPRAACNDRDLVLNTHINSQKDILACCCINLLRQLQVDAALVFPGDRPNPAAEDPKPIRSQAAPAPRPR